MKIFSIGYKKRTGKDQFCQFLATQIRRVKKDSVVRICGFADELKNTCQRLYGWAGLKSIQFYEDQPEKKEVILPVLGKTPRQIWIEFGSWCRQYDADIWKNALLKNASCDYLLIKDMGFNVEFDDVKDQGGYCFKMVRPGQVQGTDEREVELDSRSDDEWDKIIHNTGTVNDLYNIVLKIVQEFIG